MAMHLEYERLVNAYVHSIVEMVWDDFAACPCSQHTKMEFGQLVFDCFGRHLTAVF